MKEYVKPTLEVVELRLEERVAGGCQNQNQGNNNGAISGIPGNCQSIS